MKTGEKTLTSFPWEEHKEVVMTFCSHLSIDQIAEEQQKFAESSEMEEFREKLRNLVREYLPRQDCTNLQGEMALEIEKTLAEFFPRFRRF